MELLEFIEKQLKNRYQITKIQCLDKIDREPELVPIFFQKECAIEKVIEKIRKNSGRYSVVILFEEDLDQMDRVVSSFQKNGLDLICIRDGQYGSCVFTRLDFERLW